MPKSQAVYCRVSTDIQRDKGLSVPRQKEWLLTEAKRLGLTSTKDYIDNGYSAKDTNRPAFRQLVADIEAGLIDAVFVYKIDRIARNVLDLRNFLELLDKRKVKFISLSENFDTANPTGRLTLTILGSLAEWERGMVVERVKDAMWDKADKGQFCGGQPPYGYDVKGKRLVVNKREAEIVKKMFRRFEALRSLRGVTQWLNDMGYKTKRGTTWAASTVRRRISDVTYLGYYTYGKRAGNSKVYLPEKDWLIRKGDFKPIISKNQFERVRTIFRQKNFRVPQRRYGVTYLLSGLMKCECGGSLTGYTHVKKNGKKYTYYRCHNHASKGSGICPGNSLAKEQIEGRILKYIRSKADIHFEEAEIEKVILRNDTDSPREKLLNMESNIKQIKKKQERLLEFIEDGSMPKEVIISRYDQLAKELVYAESRYQRLKEELNPKAMENRIVILEKVRSLNGNFQSLPNKTKKEILQQLIKQITVTRGGDVEIEMYEL